MSFTANRLRLPLETARPVGRYEEDSVIRDQLTNAAPRIAHGRALGVEVAIINNGVLDPLTGLLSLTLEIKSAANGVINTGTALLSKTVDAASFNAALTQEQWDNDSGTTPYHAIFTFADTEIAALSMTSAVRNELEVGLVVTGLTANGRVSCGRGLVTLVQDGGTGAGSGTVPLASYTLSDQELLAALATKVSLGENADGAGFTLFDKNGGGKGIRFWVEVPAGETEPVLRQAIVERS